MSQPRTELRTMRSQANALKTSRTELRTRKSQAHGLKTSSGENRTKNKEESSSWLEDIERREQN